MNSIVTQFLAVATAVAEWISTAFNAISPMFYVAETGFTWLGVLTIIGVAFAIILLVMNYIRDFIRLR